MEATTHKTSDSRVTFLNKCQCIVDYDKLQAALYWFGFVPKKRVIIYLTMKYPTLSIRKDGKRKFIQVHRLIGMFNHKEILPRDIHVHHIDENKLNAMSWNLEIKTMSEHIKHHHSIKPPMPQKEVVKMNYERLLAQCRERHKKIGSPIAVLQPFSAFV